MFLGANRQNAADRDPEVARHIIDSAPKRMGTTMEQLGGFVARTMRDGQLALFVAHHTRFATNPFSHPRGLPCSTDPRFLSLTMNYRSKQ